MINADMKYSDESRQISIGVIWKTTTSRMGMALLHQTQVRLITVQAVPPDKRAPLPILKIKITNSISNL
ncbi:MAG: hypothetical protein COA68_02330 [Oceanobacter sp.]|nr:MAG: hypothetical protein COA68_02330 [Oceanobacter sp.]